MDSSDSESSDDSCYTPPPRKPVAPPPPPRPAPKPVAEPKKPVPETPGDEFDQAILDLAEVLKTSGQASPRKAPDSLPTVFQGVEEYQAAHRALILEECKTILTAAWENALSCNSTARGARDDENNASAVVKALGCTVKVCMPSSKDCFCFLEILKPQGCRVWFDPGKVVFMQQGDVVKGVAIVDSSTGTSHVFRIRLGSPFDSGQYDVLVLENMTTARRGFVSVSSLQKFSAPLRTQILNPSVASHSLSWLEDESECNRALELHGNFLSHLNRQQLLAVIASTRLKQGFLLVQGPPGTGKTTTVLGMVSAALATDRNMKILVSAPSNGALDEIAVRMTTGLYARDGKKLVLGRGDILRLGPRSSVSSACYQLTVDSILAGQPRHQREEAEHSLLRRASIICSTLSSCGHWYFDEMKLKFDLIIIDEAVQGVEADILIAISRGKERCIMVGDPCQLPATVFQHPASAFRRSLFERMQEAGSKPHFLDTQYRMHKFISSFPSRQFYNGALKDAEEGRAQDEEVLEKRRKIIRAGHLSFCLDHYTFLDLGWGVDELDDQSRSRFNNEEALAVAAVVRGVLRNVSRPVNIGVITPYSFQKQVILHQLSQQERSSCEVNTIDGFQGREKDVIVVSCVRAQQGIGFVSDERRLNVALTRAKSILIVIGHAETLQCKSPVWKALIEDARSRGFYQALAKPGDSRVTSSNGSSRKSNREEVIEATKRFSEDKLDDLYASDEEEEEQTTGPSEATLKRKARRARQRLRKKAQAEAGTKQESA